MSKIDIVYLEELRTQCTHENGTTLLTDGPKDLQGKGENFSPTDLFAASVGSCMLTFMGMVARKLSLDLKGARAEVEKEMVTTPKRRVGKITVHIYSSLKPSEEAKKKFEDAALSCSVHASLHPDIEKIVEFHWGS